MKPHFFLKIMSKISPVQNWYNESGDYYLQKGDVLFSDILDTFLSFVPDAGFILDMGSGSGRDVDYFVESGHRAMGMDISEKMIEYAKKNFRGEFLHGDFSDTKQRSEIFDAVWSSSALFTHLDSKYRNNALNEVARVLKPKGVFGCIVMEKDSRPLPRQPIPFYRFEREELKRELLKHGFFWEHENIFQFHSRPWIFCIARKGK